MSLYTLVINEFQKRNTKKGDWNRKNQYKYTETYISFHSINRKPKKKKINEEGFYVCVTIKFNVNVKQWFPFSKLTNSKQNHLLNRNKNKENVSNQFQMCLWRRKMRGKKIEN